MKVTKQQILDALNATDKAQSEANAVISSIPGLSQYDKANIKLLLDTYDLENVKAFVKIAKDIGKRIYKVKNRNIYITERWEFLGIGETPKTFQITKHTLYTFLSESNIRPTDLIVLQKGI